MMTTRRAHLRLEELDARITPTLIYTVKTKAWTAETDQVRFDAAGNAFKANNKPLSLLEAIQSVNAFNLQTQQYVNPGPSVIRFEVGTGLQTFTQANAGGVLYVQQPNTTIDGTTQPGYVPNTAPFGEAMNGKIRIELNMRVYLNGSLNTIKGVSARGIDIADNWRFYGADVTGNRIEGNYLGLRADGKTSWDDTQEGIFIGVGPNGQLVGGRPKINIITGNLIAGHTKVSPTYGAVGNAILIDDSSDNYISGNYIGTDYTGKAGPGNLLSGVRIKSTPDSDSDGVEDQPDYNSIIDNVIAFNKDYGTRIEGGVSNYFSRNSLFENGTSSAGGGLFVSPSANRNQPAPQLIAVNQDGTVSGRAFGTPNQDVRLDFYSAGFNLDPAGQYEGRTYLGLRTVRLNSEGTFDFRLALDAAPTGMILATATAAQADTSPYSNEVASPNSRTWTGGGKTAKWSDGDNWQEGTAPTDGSSLTFPAGAARTTNVNNVPGLQLQDLRFEGSYNVSGQKVDVQGDVNVTGGQTNFNVPMGTGGGTEFFSGRDVGPRDAPPEATVFNIAQGAVFTLGKAVSGTAGFVKDGLGELVLKARSAAMAGNAYLRSGTIDAEDDRAIGTGDIEVAAGAVVTLKAKKRVFLVNDFILQGGTLNLDGPITLLFPVILQESSTIVVPTLEHQPRIVGGINGGG